MHLVLLLLGIFGLPSFMSPKPLEEPMAVTVELVPISAMSNIKPSQQQPAEPKQEAPKPTPKEAPPVKVAEDTPPPPPEPSILPKPKPAPPPKPKEAKKEKPKPKHDDLAAILKAVKETAQKQKNDTKQAEDDGSKSKSNSYNPSLPMSLSEIDAIRNQIAKCWNVPAGARNAHELIVVLRLQLAPDGSVMRVDLTNESQSRYASDTFFRAAADSARRAVQECSPLKNLPQDKYTTWRDMEMTFDPKNMLF
jgi:hypothetical protein